MRQGDTVLSQGTLPKDIGGAIHKHLASATHLSASWDMSRDRREQSPQKRREVFWGEGGGERRECQGLCDSVSSFHRSRDTGEIVFTRSHHA